MSYNSSDLGPWDNDFLNPYMLKIPPKDTFPLLNKLKKSNKRASSHFLPFIPKKFPPQKNESFPSLEIKLKKHEDSNSRIITKMEEMIDAPKVKEKKPISLKESMIKKRELYVPKIKEHPSETICFTTKSIFSVVENNDDNEIKNSQANTEKKNIKSFLNSTQEKNQKTKTDEKEIWIIEGFEAPLNRKKCFPKNYKNFKILEHHKKQENEPVSFAKKLKIRMKAVNLLKNMLENSEKQTKHKMIERTPYSLEGGC